MILTEADFLNSFSVVAGEPIKNNSIAFVNNKKAFQSCPISEMHLTYFPVYVYNANVPGEPYEHIINEGMYLRCVKAYVHF